MTQTPMTPELMDLALNLMAQGMHMDAALAAAAEMVELADLLALEIA